MIVINNQTDHGYIPVAAANNANNGQGITKWATQSWAPAMAKKMIGGKDKFFLYFANSGGGIGIPNNSASKRVLFQIDL